MVREGDSGLWGEEGREGVLEFEVCVVNGEVGGDP